MIARRRLFCAVPALLSLPLLAAAPARAVSSGSASEGTGSGGTEPSPCTVPEGMAFTGFSLPQSRSQIVEGKQLAVLMIGGASMGGTASGGRDHSLPGRLDARMRAAMPGVEITVASRGVAGGNARIAADHMAGNIRETGASLVIWEAGMSAAADGDDLTMFGTNLESGINAAKRAKADIILMDLQYAPSIAMVTNQVPYCDAIRRAAEMEEIPLLRRFELMRAWSESGEFKFDASAPSERMKVARKLYDCLAAILASGISEALR